MRAQALTGVVAAAVGVAAAIALAGSPAASATTAAGSYTITACSPSASAGGWTPINQAAASLTTTNQCGGVTASGPDDAAVGSIAATGALFSNDQIGSATPVPTGYQAGWELTAPAGVEITGVSYYSSYETDGDGWLSGLQIDGVPQSSDCETNLDHTSPCEYYNNQIPQADTALSATTLFFGVECSQVDGGVRCLPSSETSHAVEAALYSAQVTLERTGAPSISDESGPLWGAGVVSGSVPLTFDATDPAGIEDAEVLGGTRAGLVNQPQSCTYTQVQACPELPADQVEINTAELPDGPQSVALVATNAAGDTSVVPGPTFIVDNDGPPAPSQLSAAAANSGSNVIDLAWANPASPPQPIAAAYVQLCQATCGTPTQISDGGAAQVTAPAAGSYTVRLWLTDTAGQGGTGNVATTTVAVPAASTKTVTTVTTTTTTTVTVPVKTSTSASCKVCPTKKQTRCPKTRCVVLKIHSARWSHGLLTFKLKQLPKGDRLKITLTYKHAHNRTLTIAVKNGIVKIKTGRPTRAILVAVRGTTSVSRGITIAHVSHAT